ncbi:unnamed protein product [Arabidopsis halleri]
MHVSLAKPICPTTAALSIILTVSIQHAVHPVPSTILIFVVSSHRRDL